ncbi:HD-GYP domain-containing protein [Desulforamulus hydrothermalis]|uniref:Metal dependent phosphohydrolase n=1 Tax=Desulforamulus hydrothermalis Lam5 = DSM 18033 TaxID=1121428 RepID=K8EIS7_9FIRM|nr:HD domain-containing phosphohydrolase [Desulforamulus hydrothermalis]CCO08516.1 Metal dependent phosphohydrolase [Desulforamulus hydrothermalis Lam5 = DSM 18033]SHH47944.1 HD domain-containing protein [Desulforamulus hydrothermalis Lam5 = DSM 18033]
MPSLITNYYKLLSSLSLAMDFNSHGLMRHHQRVALMALQIGKLYGLSSAQLEKLFTAAILHDAGSSTWEEKNQLTEFLAGGTLNHCKKGYGLFYGHSLFGAVADIILHHHDRWDGLNNACGLRGEQIPIESRIIHLADRIDVLIRDDVYILEQKKYICRRINEESSRLFDPRLVEAFNDLSARECFWLDLQAEFMADILAHHCPVTAKELGLSEVTAVAETVARVIDFKSPFTRRHSGGVARVARLLAARAGFSEQHCDIVKVAGLLHDLGKLGVPDAILNKPGKLTESEYNIMKKHTYYTFQILKMIDGFDTINHYASCHHETLNGMGYPFKLDRSDLKTGARIVAVADIFTALTEERPYRQPLAKEQVINIMANQVKKGAIDGELTDLLLADYREAWLAGQGDCVNILNSR